MASSCHDLSGGGDSPDQSENIKVVARCRPMSKKEMEHNCTSIVQFDHASKTITVDMPASQERSPMAAQAESKMFTFHHAFSTESSQEEVYNAVARPIVENVLEGYNGTIFAYGQTGSGKTFTMEGQSSPPELKGIIPNSFAQIFSSIAKAKEKQSYLVRCSYLEVYNENVRDLLCKDENHFLELKENKDKEVYVKDLTSLVVVDAEDMDRVMMVGNKNRSVASTNMNSVSSRSHAIFSIVVECSTETDGDQRTLRMGKLNLVDLAGSERVRKTLVTGDRLKEATKINLSLSNLGNVISALVEGNSYIPYRNSKLTRLLQDSLGGNSKTVMVATIGPADFNYEETISTLRYATRAKHIRNCAKINEDPKDAILRRYQEEILRLRTLLEQKKFELHNRATLPPKKKKISTDKQQNSIDERIGTLLEEQKRIDEKYKDELKSLLEPYGIKAEGSQQEILDDLERRRVALVKDGAAVKEEKQRFFEELQQATDAMINSKRQCRELFHRVMSLESQLQKSLQADEELKSKEKELAEQRKREETLRKTLELKKLTSKELKKELSKLQDEIEKKQKTLNALNEKQAEYTGKTQNVHGLHGKNLKELQDLKNELTKEFKLKKLIVDNFIPRKILKKIEARVRYDEVTDTYVLAPRDDLTFERPPINKELPGPFLNLTRFKQFPRMSNVFFSDENLIAVEPDPPVPRSQELVVEEEDPILNNYIKETMRELNQEVVIICDHRKGKYNSKF